MTTNLCDIDPGPACPTIVRMIVEIPRNSRNKYEFDRDLGVFRLDRFFVLADALPGGDYGFIRGTLGEDGDPLDVLGIADEPSFPGCLVEVRPVGVLRMIDRSEPHQKILAVQQHNPRYEGINDATQLFRHLRREIEHFFTIYKELENKKTRIHGWQGAAAAHRTITARRKRFLARKFTTDE
ncbi:MAG TPA: inorganic diphosphatase [Candidatus Acidoferrales bacterium]|nr:inorganic diphosphatase [Candidatus Acidoferrales bacterium]